MYQQVGFLMHNCLIQQLKAELTVLMWDYDRLFQIIEELIMHHSPSGAEAEINQLLIQRFTALGVEVWCERNNVQLTKMIQNGYFNTKCRCKCKSNVKKLSLDLY